MYVANQRKHLFFLEFNELSAVLIDQLIEQGELPNFKKFRDQSSVCRTVAEEQGYELEPWVQWVTVHTGASLAKHGVRNLGDNRNLQVKTIGQLLCEAGLTVGIFGSMNLRQESITGYYVPDPWDRNGKTYPSSIQGFYDIVSNQVRGNSENSMPSIADLRALAWYLLRNGIRTATVAYGIRQLLSELRNRNLAWRRATVLDRLNYDVSRCLNQAHKPNFSTYFSNSTAHFQHYYWQNFEPKLFPNRNDVDLSAEGNAILYGYQNVDYLLGRFMTDYPDSVLVLVTALSQEPWVDTIKQTYRPANFEKLLSFCGVSPENLKIRPIMAEEFRVEVANDTDRQLIERAIKSTTVDGLTLLKAQKAEDSVVLGCAIERQVREDAICVNWHGDSINFLELFSPIHGVRSGRHNREGVLWIRNHRSENIDMPVSLNEIAPAVLDYFGVEKPASMMRATFLI